MRKILFIAFLFIFCIGTCCLNNYPDYDLWARLIAGAHVIETHSILKTDFLSYTPTHIWYDHEWGASTIFYFVFKYFGAQGLMILKGLLCAFTLFFCYKTIEIRKPQSTIPYNILYFVLMFLAVLKSLGPLIRCLLFTCLFFSIFIYILELSRNGRKKPLILLPFIMILWSNIHGGCISGLGIIGVYCLGEFLNKKSYKEYLISFFTCCAALFINPYGIGYVKFLFSAATLNRNYIAEWASPFSHKFFYQYLKFKLYLVIMLLTEIIYLIKNKVNYEKLDKTKFLIIILMTYLSVTHVRHQSFFIFTVGTFLYDEFYSLFNKLIAKIKIPESLILLKEITVYFILFIVSFPYLISQNKEVRITETEYPRYAIEFVKINNIKGNLFINFDWGSYAAYKLYPNNLIVMDGRYEEVYDPKLLLQLKDFHLLKNDWYKIIRDYKTDVMILEKKYPVYNKIKEHPDWALVFENNLSGVFVPINNFKDYYLYPPVSNDYYNNNLFQTDIKFKKNKRD